MCRCVGCVCVCENGNVNVWMCMLFSVLVWIITTRCWLTLSLFDTWRLPWVKILNISELDQGMQMIIPGKVLPVSFVEFWNGQKMFFQPLLHVGPKGLTKVAPCCDSPSSGQRRLIRSADSLCKKWKGWGEAGDNPPVIKNGRKIL